MKIRGWMVTKNFELNVPLTVRVNANPSNWAGERFDFADGIFSFDRSDIKTLVFAGSSGYKYVDNIPSSGSHELMVVAGPKDGVFVSFSAANAEYAKVEAAKNAGSGSGGTGGIVKDPGQKEPPDFPPTSNFLDWIKAHWFYIAVPGLLVLGWFVFGKKLFKKLFKK